MRIAPSSHRALQAAARNCLPRTIGVSVTDPRAKSRQVFPEEQQAVRRAREPRLREFANGRNAARGAMIGLGLDVRAVPMGQDRAPVWPEGLTGSITHDDTACVAIAATRQNFRALGADLEPDADLPSDLIPEICTKGEQDWLRQQSFSQQGRYARMIFSAKECTYKCQYALSGQMLEFQDLKITLSGDKSEFQARFLRAAPPFAVGTVLRGHCLIVSGHILTLMTLPNQQAGEIDTAMSKEVA